HEQGGRPAQDRAIPVEFDAAGHHFYVLFAQARARAVSTFIRAMVAGFNAVDVFFLWHNDSFSFGKTGLRSIRVLSALFSAIKLPTGKSRTPSVTIGFEIGHWPQASVPFSSSMQAAVG